MTVYLFAAVGCADIQPPPNGWVKRNANKVMISCNGTGEVRHLVCNGTAWVGDVSDCAGGKWQPCTMQAVL